MNCVNQHLALEVECGRLKHYDNFLIFAITGQLAKVKQDEGEREGETSHV